MEWTRNKVCDLIALYEAEECLWNVRSTNYKNAHLKQAAFRKIASILNTTSGEVEKKIKSLVFQFRREKRKLAAGEHYTPKWFGFEAMRFLDDIQETKEAAHTLNTEVLQDLPIAETGSTTAEAAGPSSERTRPPPSKRQKRAVGQHGDHSYLHGGDAAHGASQARHDDAVHSASQMLQRVLQKYDSRDNDDCSAFGRYIACQLRTLPPYERALTKNKIYKVLFESEVEFYKKTQQTMESSVCVDVAGTSGPSVTFITTDAGNDLDY